MNDDERTRYDRQVRLWGKGTQERLRQTQVRVVGITAALAEAAKDLVLAGVGSIVLDDASPVDTEDLRSCFILQGRNLGEPRGGAAANRLQSLNPYVKVVLDTADGDKGALSHVDTSFRAVLVSARSESEMMKVAAEPRNSSADVVLLTTNLGHLTVGFFLLKRRETPFVAQLEAMLSQSVGPRPAVFHRVLLLLKMADAPEELSFFERLLLAKQVAAHRGLTHLTQEDMELAAGVTRAQTRSSIIDATVAGGVFAQLIIQMVGEGTGEAGEGEKEYGWVISDTADGVDVQVGRLFSP